MPGGIHEITQNTATGSGSPAPRGSGEQIARMADLWFQSELGKDEVWNFWIIYPAIGWVLLTAAGAWSVYARKPISERGDPARKWIGKRAT